MLSSESSAMLYWMCKENKCQYKGLWCYNLSEGEGHSSSSSCYASNSLVILLSYVFDTKLNANFYLTCWLWENFLWSQLNPSLLSIGSLLSWGSSEVISKPGCIGVITRWNWLIITLIRFQYKENLGNSYCLAFRVIVQVLLFTWEPSLENVHGIWHGKRKNWGFWREFFVDFNLTWSLHLFERSQ